MLKLTVGSSIAYTIGATNVGMWINKYNLK